MSEVQNEPVKLDASEVEKQLLEEAKVNAEKVDPLEMASMMLTLYTPRFRGLVDKLSSKQLRRVTKSLVEFPIGKTYRHNDQAEAECFAIGKNLLDAKFVMIAHTYNENREKMLQQAAEAAGRETGEVNNEKEVNNVN